MNIEKELQSICDSFQIKIEETRLYVNESVWYGFETQEDMLIAATELLKVLNTTRISFKITLHNEEAHAIEIFDTDI